MRSLLALLALTLLCVSPLHALQLNDGTAAKPLRVMLIPADGGTESGTKADFMPLFNAVSKTTGLVFDVKVGQSYGSVIEAMSNGQIEIAFFGAVSYTAARKRGAAELLAVSVEKGASVYYSGIFVRSDSGINSFADLKGKSLALGDVNSTSSFNYPVAMLLAEKVDLINGMGAIVMAGSHANSLAALNEGKVQVCAASFDSFEKAVKQNAIDPTRFKVLAKSIPIPNPPLAMHTGLPAATKKMLRDAFGSVHQAPGVTPDMIRGYGGKKVERYDTTISEEVMAEAVAKLDAVTDQVKAAILTKAGAAK
jgi:phosphonate transport system substrate-binding protein